MPDVPVRSGDDSKVLESLIVEGDLSRLTPVQRVAYYNRVCESIGLNPYTQPFQYLFLNGKLTLYAGRNCADQLRKIHNVSLQVSAAELQGDLYTVRIKATLPDGRQDEEIGAVNVSGLRGDAYANAVMKAYTKAKRRATLSIVGLGWLDESEVASIPGARRVDVNISTGEIEDPEAMEPRPSEDKLRALWASARRAGLNQSVLKAKVESEYGKTSLRDLTMPEYELLSAWLETHQVRHEEAVALAEEVEALTDEVEQAFSKPNEAETH